MSGGRSSGGVPALCSPLGLARFPRFNGNRTIGRTLYRESVVNLWFLLSAHVFRNERLVDARAFGKLLLGHSRSALKPLR